MDVNKKHPPSFFKIAKNEIISFFAESNVPGFKYIVQSRALIERVAWAILLALVFFITGRIINSQWIYWKSHPVETTIDEVGLPVDLLPFPAITVCDTDSLKMPRKNQWMFVEKLLNSFELENPEEESKWIYPGQF